MHALAVLVENIYIYMYAYNYIYISSSLDFSKSSYPKYAEVRTAFQIVLLDSSRTCQCVNFAKLQTSDSDNAVDSFPQAI